MTLCMRKPARLARKDSAPMSLEEAVQIVSAHLHSILLDADLVQAAMLVIAIKPRHRRRSSKGVSPC